MEADRGKAELTLLVCLVSRQTDLQIDLTGITKESYPLSSHLNENPRTMTNASSEPFSLF